MAAFSLVHGAWHGGWAWDRVRAELEERGHAVFAPDLPCDDVSAGAEEYAAAVPPADVVVGHSLGGMTIPRVEARLYVFLTALVAGTGWQGVFAPGFGAARTRDELGRSLYPDTAAAAREFQYPRGCEELAARIRPQAPYDPEPVAPPGRVVYVVCTRDAVILPEWQRHLARDVLGVEPIELDSGHSPMLECPAALAELLDALAAEAE
jgi:pimeloyl-ACP methyl ester carboxylesterase